MILYEIEDMDTNVKGLVQFSDQFEADKVLIEKGFLCLEKYECYAGNSVESGNEISVMKAIGVHHTMLKNVTHK